MNPTTDWPLREVYGQILEKTMTMPSDDILVSLRRISPICRRYIAGVAAYSGADVTYKAIAVLRANTELQGLPNIAARVFAIMDRIYTDGGNMDQMIMKVGEAASRQVAPGYPDYRESLMPAQYEILTLRLVSIDYNLPEPLWKYLSILGWLYLALPPQSDILPTVKERCEATAPPVTEAKNSLSANIVGRIEACVTPSILDQPVDQGVINDLYSPGWYCSGMYAASSASEETSDELPHLEWELDSADTSRSDSAPSTPSDRR